MAYKTLIFGVDDLFPILKTFYEREIQRGNFEIVAYAVFEQNGIRIVTPQGRPGGSQLRDVQLAIISSKNDFYRRMKILEANGFPRNRIIDGRIFKQVPELNLSRLLAEGVAYGVLKKDSFASSFTVYPRVYSFEDSKVIFSLGMKSYIGGNANLDGDTGSIIVGKFSALSWKITFELGRNHSHNYRNVSSISINNIDWAPPEGFYPKEKPCKILIGNDAWIGRGCILKATNPDKPLVIGDGAVVASDSVVVKNVPPYAIVGGNPAQIIKYRFEPHVIESLLRIKWWDWSLDKIHDNFKYFNDLEKFIALHDKA